jgi:hypothetical protein
VVSIQSKNAMRKALARLGRRALPEVEDVITRYVIRHQVLADTKATSGEGEQVAAVGGITVTPYPLHQYPEYRRALGGRGALCGARAPD